MRTQWVRSHQDHEHPLENLPDESIFNARVDHLTQEVRTLSHGSGKSPLRSGQDPVMVRLEDGVPVDGPVIPALRKHHANMNFAALSNKLLRAPPRFWSLRARRGGQGEFLLERGKGGPGGNTRILHWKYTLGDIEGCSQGGECFL